MEDVQIGEDEVAEYMVRLICLCIVFIGMQGAYDTLPLVCRKECDTAGRGSLDREAFVKGMWRIDEELRKAQTSARHGKTSVRPPKGLASVLR